MREMVEAMKVIVKYKLGHSLTFEYLRTDWFCPKCGKKALYENQDGGDYYAGPSVVCIACDSSMCSGYFPEKSSPEDMQVIEQIKDHEEQV